MTFSFSPTDLFMETLSIHVQLQGLVVESVEFEV